MNPKIRIKALNKESVTEIYDCYMKEDFPPSELKSLPFILSLMDKGNYFCYGIYEEEKLAAYAYLCKAGGSCVLVDYYAVLSGLRSKGYGSTILKMLKEACAAYDGILFEVESGLTAKTKEELSTVKRRIAFYLKNGVRETRISTLQFGVDLRIFYLPIIREFEEKELFDELSQIYQVVFAKEMRQNQVSLAILDMEN